MNANIRLTEIILQLISLNVDNVKTVGSVRLLGFQVFTAVGMNTAASGLLRCADRQKFTDVSEVFKPPLSGR
jgi:uncharacterized ferredoxin-like protein